MSFRRTSEPCHTYLPEPLPSGANIRKSAVYCQPSDDSDVTDAIRVRRYGPMYNGLYMPASENNIAEDVEFPHAAGPAERFFKFPVTHNDSGNDLPIQNTSLCAVNNSCPSDINLHSDQCVEEARNPAYRDDVEDVKGDFYQHDGGGCTVDGRGEEDCPVFGNTPTVSPMDSGQVMVLKRNYNKLLEKQQQFVISNARLHDANEELLGRVEDLEKELTDAREEVRLLQSEKMQMMRQLLSCKRMLGDKGQQTIQQETGDVTPCGSGDMQSSNMKEELCEMIMLTLTQQKELQSLYQTVKRQNETIKNLARPRTEEHRPLAEPEEERLAMFSPQASHNTQPLKVAQRCNPEGSSIDVIKLPVSGRKSDPIHSTQDKTADPVTFKDSFLKMFGSQKQRNTPEKPSSATTKTVANTLLPGATVAKQRPASARQSSPTTNNKTVFVKGPPVMIRSEGACNVEVQSTEFDPERSGFVLVNKREREMRICPLCSKKFPSGGETEMQQFMHHVSGCVPPDDYRQCPMCLEKFDKKFSDYEFEVHVNEHFDEDRLMCLSPLDKNK